GLPEDPRELLDRLALAPLDHAPARDIPVLAHAAVAVLPHQVVGRGYLCDALQNRGRRLDGPERQVVVERLQTDRALNGPVLEKGLELRGEEQTLAILSVVQRLLSHPVPSQEQA